MAKGGNRASMKLSGKGTMRKEGISEKIMRTTTKGNDSNKNRLLHTNFLGDGTTFDPNNSTEGKHSSEDDLEDFYLRQSKKKKKKNINTMKKKLMDRSGIDEVESDQESPMTRKNSLNKKGSDEEESGNDSPATSSTKTNSSSKKKMPVDGRAKIVERSPKWRKRESTKAGKRGLEDIFSRNKPLGESSNYVVNFSEKSMRGKGSYNVGEETDPHSGRSRRGKGEKYSLSPEDEENMMSKSNYVMKRNMKKKGMKMRKKKNMGMIMMKRYMKKKRE